MTRSLPIDGMNRWRGQRHARATERWTRTRRSSGDSTSVKKQQTNSRPNDRRLQRKNRTASQRGDSQCIATDIRLFERLRKFVRQKEHGDETRTRTDAIPDDRESGVRFAFRNVGSVPVFVYQTTCWPRASICRAESRSTASLAINRTMTTSWIGQEARLRLRKGYTMGGLSYADCLSK